LEEAVDLSSDRLLMNEFYTIPRNAAVLHFIAINTGNTILLKRCSKSYRISTLNSKSVISLRNDNTATLYSPVRPKGC
jgi:hypothetical protein